MINFINRVSIEELNKIKKDYEIYIDTSKKLFENFIDKRNPFTISLLDKNGLVLLVCTAERKPLIKEGMLIDENLGVTAILEVIKNQKECEILGNEHTLSILKSWSCAASPIKDIKGNIVCIISISSEKEKYPPYGLKLVKLISNAIENEVNLKIILKEIELSKHFAEVIAEGNKDGVLVLDKNAKVLYINQVGANILKIDREKAIGKNVTEIVDFTPVILNVFKTHKGYIDKEFIIESPSRGLLHFY